MINRFVTKMHGMADLTSVDVAALEAATAKSRCYAPATDLIRDGDEPGPMFIVLDGWVCRYKTFPQGARQILAILMPGDVCDLHTELLTQMDHGIQAITPALIASVEQAKVQAMMAAHPNIARAMYKAKLVDDGILRAWIARIGQRRGIERVAHLLCELYLRACNIGIDCEGGFILPLPQRVLADALGLTAVHFNRVLRELRLSGAMGNRYGKLTIVDPDKLVTIAGFDENYLHRSLHQSA